MFQFGKIINYKSRGQGSSMGGYTAWGTARISSDTDVNNASDDFSSQFSVYNLN